MIQAKDLRCGNLVMTIADEPEFLKVTQIDGIEGVVILESFDKPIGVEGIEPIPLDEGWLTRAGFEWAAGKRKSHLGVELYEKSWLYFYFNENGLMELTQLCDTSDIGQFDFPALRYVHQLQNLYYALTGTELEFKPK